MYSLELVITVGIATLIIGAVIGVVFAQRNGASLRTQRQLEAQLDELQQQSREYQHEVTEHFNETAELLNQLTASYRDVHNHLAKGAQTLAAGSSAPQTLKILRADEPGRQQEEDHPITPPLDYAPKAADQPGMLNEEFGLEKVASGDDDTVTANRPQ